MIVIADDITGAAEIAGIAFSLGQEVRLVMGGRPLTPTKGSEDVVVIATDTRSMSENEAVAETCHIATPLPFGGGEALFKKTDSALRGHVVAELTALMQATGYHRAVYLPANPSKERIIRHGIYYIKGVPIHETDFSFDPEFPANTSVLKERFPDAEAQGIIMPDAVSEDDIRHVVATYNDGNTIFAGAADLFRASLSPSKKKEATAKLSGEREERRLILCGSTQSKALSLGIPVAPMPREVYDGKQGADYWYAQLSTSPHQQGSAENEGSLILTIPHTHRTGKEVAVHLRIVMAEMAKRLVNERQPNHLIIEGGATAWATLQALGWIEFQIERQVAPGVVQMSAANGTLVTLKPGSYSWGGLF